MFRNTTTLTEPKKKNWKHKKGQTIQTTKKTPRKIKKKNPQKTNSNKNNKNENKNAYSTLIFLQCLFSKIKIK